MGVCKWVYIHGGCTWVYVHGCMNMGVCTWGYVHGCTYMGVHTWVYVRQVILHLIKHTYVGTLFKQMPYFSQNLLVFDELKIGKIYKKTA